MAVFTKESLENLRQRVNLIDVLSSHLEMKKAGAAYKALCPFHDEKTPSFTVQKGDSHYHCFGCGAHGDSISFLMNHLKMSFGDAVESLAQRFNVPLETLEGNFEAKGPNKKWIREALQHAAHFFHFSLLHTKEGHEAAHYLFSRGITLDFLRSFEIGYAPPVPGLLKRYLNAKGISDETLIETGLFSLGRDGKMRDFFQDRIPIPIHDPMGHVIGFSARKFKEATFGGKYINTPETVLFKKSRVLFGLNYCRKRIAKERRVLVVEGQMDALRLIEAGFNFTVAGQGTAFGEGHVKELMSLGINQAYLALDSDTAGQEAAAKIGHLFQAEGVEVRVLSFPKGHDPDSYLREQGPKGMLKLIQSGSDYLSYLVKHLSLSIDIASPAGKNELIRQVSERVRSWDHPVLVHESLRRLAHLMQIPESTIGIGQEYIPNILIKKSANVGLQTIDPDRILECDFLRWLLLLGDSEPDTIALARANITPEDLRTTVCRHIYLTYLECCDAGTPKDLLSLTIKMDSAEGQLVLSEILQKKINREKPLEQLSATIQRILDRNWMQRREEIRMRIQSGLASDEEVFALVRQFEEIRKNSPQVKTLERVDA